MTNEVSPVPKIVGTPIYKKNIIQQSTDTTKSNSLPTTLTHDNVYSFPITQSFELSAEPINLFVNPSVDEKIIINSYIKTAMDFYKNSKLNLNDNEKQKMTICVGSLIQTINNSKSFDLIKWSIKNSYILLKSNTDGKLIKVYFKKNNSLVKRSKRTKKIVFNPFNFENDLEMAKTFERAIIYSESIVQII